MPGATRYELYADPDGAGPLPEAKVDDYNQTSGTGFQYLQVGAQGFTGALYGTGTAASMTASLNSSYRLRACDASGCGAFTAAKAHDIANGISHEFASGRVPLRSSRGLDGNPRLSQDGLTLAVRAPSAGADSAVYVFTRGSSAQLWRLHAELRSGKSYFGQQIALSADGSTLAVQANEQSSGDVNAYKGVVYLYQRSGSTWNQQAYFKAPSAPSACTQPCRADITGQLALSADGNLLAASAGFGTSAGSGSTSIGAVVTYTRTGASWTQQAYLETGGRLVSSLALSNDGNTLAVNEGALDTRDAQLAANTPFVRVFARQGNGTWSQQARMPAGVVATVDITGSLSSAMALSSDGNTLAVHALNVPGHQTSALDLKAADLSCGAMVDAWYVALYVRNGSTWQRQTAISRGLAGYWALASDGGALFYGNALFARNGGIWACPQA
ncbi:MAG: hypothetical protein J7556_13550 [Acidovorax sp.]|nr:hypothetical protein [Acidovorax sp.]